MPKPYEYDPTTPLNDKDRGVKVAAYHQHHKVHGDHTAACTHSVAVLAATKNGTKAPAVPKAGS